MLQCVSMRNILYLTLIFTSLTLQAEEATLEFIKKNYEYNIELIEQTYAQNNIHIDLDEKDKTIGAKKARQLLTYSNRSR